MENNGNCYTEESIVKWHDVDIRQEMRPYAFMNLAQEIAGTHASSLHFGYNDLKESNQIWVLSRIKVRYVKYPKWGNRISLQTWHKGMQSLFGLRDFVLREKDVAGECKYDCASNDTGGNICILATSSWLIMNSKTRKIERSNVFNANSGILQMTGGDNAIEEPCERLRTQPDMQKIAEHTVMYSDIDNLMHTNNAKYAEWITNSIDIGVFKKYRIKEFQINFNAETRLGEKIEIFCKEIETPAKIAEANNLSPDSRTFYLEGRKEGTVAFESLFTFVPAEAD